MASIFEPYDPFLSKQPTSPRSVFSLFEDNPGAALAINNPAAPSRGVRVYIGAAIQHLFVFLILRERRGYWGTFPVVAYGGAAPSLFSSIPILGYLVGLYGVYVTTVGLREMRGTSTGRALLAASSRPC